MKRTVSLLKTALKIWLICTAVFFAAAVRGAVAFGLRSSEDPEKIVEDIANAQADSWEWIGGTMVFSGNIRIPFRDMIFYCDRVIYDTENNDIELIGNVQVHRVVKSSHVVPVEEYQRLLGRANISVKLTGYVIDPLGGRQLNIDVWIPGESICAETVTGNLDTGWFQFTGLTCDFGSFLASAARGERTPDGIVELEDVEFSTCEYLNNNKSHYSLGASHATVKPHQTGYDGRRNYNTDKDEHSILAWNCTLRVYGIPIFWLPMFYKPKDQTLGLFQLVVGKSGDFGYFVSASRKFVLSDYPLVSVRPRVDWFQKRGIGYGATGEVVSENSKTDLFAYGIHDRKPYDSSKVEEYRLKIPKDRYSFHISNVTHISPRLDFRGLFNYSSDYYFLRDYKRDDFDGNPEPPTYAALEYEGDRFSLSLAARPQVNNFYSTVQQLPSLILNIPRQEIFGTGLYYQGQHSIEYLSLHWRDFDRRIYEENEYGFYREIKNPRDYDTFRFDSVNFLYYPVNLFGVLNIVPRAGIRLTDYTRSSKYPVHDDDIGRMINTTRPESLAIDSFTNYDNKGGNRFRVVGELGAEASMKFYRTWQNVRSPFLNLDGLRHVAEPYVNYTFITNPTVADKYLYYFDEIDRIDETNFIRFGIRNRLQTRRGSATAPTICNWFTMDNYWDIFFKTESGQSHAGDIGTMLTFTPGNGFSMSADVSININDDYVRKDVYRNGRNVGRPGLAKLDCLNYLHLSMSYALLEDLIFTVSYSLEDSYRSRSIYSMGSTFNNPNATSCWDNYTGNMSQTVSFGVDFPITKARDFRGSYRITYDFYQGGISEQTLRLIKTLHCWSVAVELRQKREWHNDGYRREYSIRATAQLNGLISPLEKVQTRLGSSLDTGENKFF